MPLPLHTPLEASLYAADKLVGTLYRWGGDDPTGWDCSGACIEVLKAGGRLPYKGDWTAHTLATMFPEHLGDPTPGCLLFWDWNNDGRIDHVELVVGNFGGVPCTLGASGGGSSTTNREDAVRRNAYVKIRPARANWSRCVNPFA